MSLSLRSLQSPSGRVQSPSPSSPKRRNGKERAEAAALEETLRDVQKRLKSPALADIIGAAIDLTHKLATRDAAAIRDEVFKAVDEGGCRYVDEIAEEIHATRWVVESVVKELANLGLFALYEESAKRRDPEGGAPRIEIHSVSPAVGAAL